MTDADKLEIFERAFSTSRSGCHRRCYCGREFYNPDDSWDWGDGEVERFEEDSGATSLEWSVGTLVFEGKEYVRDCDCWHARALQIIRFLESHAQGVAGYLNGRKKAASQEAEAMPEVGEEAK